MSDKLTKLAILKKTIGSDAFITKDQSYIHSPDLTEQEWLFDFRAIMLRPEILNLYADLFLETFPETDTYQVAGIEVAAIPLVAAIVVKSDELGKPVNGFFIRKSRKKTGLLKQIEGTVLDRPVILVDDLINSGSSFLKQVEIIDQYRNDAKGELGNLEVIAVQAILRFRNIEAYTTLCQRGITINSFFCLDDFSDLGLRNLASLSHASPPNKYSPLWHWRGGSPSLEHVKTKAGLAVTKDNVFTITDDGKVFCLRAEDGTTEWVYDISPRKKSRGQFSTPILFGGSLYFGAHDGNVYALEAETGKRQWVSFEGDWVGSSPYLDQETRLLYIATENGFLGRSNNLNALNIDTGELIWSYKLPAPVSAAPIYSRKNKSLIIVTRTGHLLMLNPENGKLKQQETIPHIEIYSSPTLNKEEDLLFVSGVGAISDKSEASAVYQYSFKTKKIEAHFTDFNFGSYGGVTICDNTLIVGSLDKHVYAVDINTTKTKWQINTGSRIFGRPLVAKIETEMKLFIGTNGGQLLEIMSTTGEITSETPLVERVTNQPYYQIDSNQLIVQTYANEIYVLRRTG